MDELQKQMKRVVAIHEMDLAEGYDGVFLDDAVERKFPKAPKELVEETGQRRRYHGTIRFGIAHLHF